MRMLFLSSFGLKVKDVNEAIANLEKVDVAGDQIGVEGEHVALLADMSRAFLEPRKSALANGEEARLDHRSTR